MSYVWLWLRAFLPTLGIELAVAIPFLPRRASRGRRALAVLVAQLATHPAVWFIWPALGWSRPAYLAAAESFAVAVEAMTYAVAFEEMSTWRAIGVSLLANGLSWGFGSFFS